MRRFGAKADGQGLESRAQQRGIEFDGEVLAVSEQYSVLITGRGQVLHIELLEPLSVLGVVRLFNFYRHHRTYLNSLCNALQYSRTWLRVSQKNRGIVSIGPQRSGLLGIALGVPGLRLG